MSNASPYSTNPKSEIKKLKIEWPHSNSKFTGIFEWPAKWPHSKHSKSDWPLPETLTLPQVNALFRLGEEIARPLGMRTFPAGFSTAPTSLRGKIDVGVRRIESSKLRYLFAAPIAPVRGRETSVVELRLHWSGQGTDLCGQSTTHNPKHLEAV